jgi:copper chaperone
LVALLALALALAGCQKQAGPTEVVLDVQGMTCGNCEQAIRTEVSRIDGVSNVRASHKEGKVWVTYEPGKVTPDALASAINRLGYKASAQKGKR